MGENGGIRTGPPIAPRMTASAFFAALRASSVSGEPVASMEHWHHDVSQKLNRQCTGVIDRTYASEQMFLEIELDIGSLFLDNSKDLDNVIRKVLVGGTLQDQGNANLECFGGDFWPAVVASEDDNVVCIRHLERFLERIGKPRLRLE